MENEPTFSGTSLRERDRILQQKHESELRGYKITLDKQKYHNEELRKSLFNSRNQASRLAQSLGFEDVIEAQLYIDREDVDGRAVAYKDRQRVAQELEELKVLKDKLEKRERELEKENTLLKRSLDESGAAYRLLTKEHSNLEDKHADLVKASDAATERRRRDAQKWENFKAWILCAAEVRQYAESAKEVSQKEKAHRLYTIVKRKKYGLKQLDNLDDANLFALADQDMKENGITPIHTLSPPAAKTSDDSTASPLSTSFNVNRPLEELHSSPSPFLENVPASLLTRTYAMKSTPIRMTPTSDVDMHDAQDLSTSPTIFDAPAAHENDAHPVASHAEDDSHFFLTPSTNVVTPRPSTVNSSPQVLEPESQTQDDTQPYSLSQFRPFTEPARPQTKPMPPPSTAASASTSRIPLVMKPVPRLSDTPTPNPASSSSRRSVLDSYTTKSAKKVAAQPSHLGGDINDSRRPARKSDGGAHTSLSRPGPSASPEGLEDDEPPRKYRRVSEGSASTNRSAVSSLSSDRRNGQRSSGTPQLEMYEVSRNQSRTRDKENTGTRTRAGDSETRMRSAERQKGGGSKGTEKTVPEKDKERGGGPSLKGTLEDYSKYKGRGRYGKEKEKAGDEDRTINEMYAIDPSRNAGKDFEYDEVVRGKEQRKKLIAGDCEECRDYYEAVGPLPPRLQQPLWKSPVKGHNSEVRSRPCPHKQNKATSSKGRAKNNREESLSFSDDDGDDQDRGSASTSAALAASHIQARKQEISRHRAVWKRAMTPPHYWDIGFPNTQMVAEINEEAKEMHRRKKEMVEREAAMEGGRYKKRKRG